MNKSRPTKIGVPKQKKYSSVVDGKHVILKCSFCNKNLIDIWITAPDLDVTMPVQADCPHCGGHSEVMEIKGGYHNGSPEDGMTEMIDIITNATIITYKTSKGVNAR